MFRKARFRTLFAQICVAMTALLALLTLLLAGLFFFSWRSIAQDSLQRLHWSLAAEVAEQMEAAAESDAGGSPFRVFQQVARRFQEANRSIDIYIVDAQGKIVADFSQSGVLHSPTIDPSRIEAFLADGERQHLPHTISDPRARSRATAFSAARLRWGDSAGYVVINLVNQQVQQLVQLSLENDSVLYLAVSSLTGLTAITLLGIFVFRRLSRRFNSITAALQEYERGKLDVDLDTSGGDELADVAQAISRMVGSIRGYIAELLAKDTIRRELILNMWHDLRGPVTSISGHIELLELHEQSYTAEKRGRFYEIMRGNIGMLTRLISELHELARLDARETTPELRPCALSSLAAELADNYLTQAQDADVALRCDIAPGLPAVWCDSAMIRRVLANLLENALRYTPRGGEVTLRLSAEDEQVLVEVRDSGIGIPEAALSQVFDRHFQVQGGTARQGASGLGLAIVKRIIESHNSTIQVTSAEGCGTCFRFALVPVAPEDSRALEMAAG